MAVQSKTTVKTYFNTGDKPTEAQFGDLIDSYQDYSQVLTSFASAASSAAIGLVKVSAGDVTFVSAGVVGQRVLAAETTAAARDPLGLGTAATENVGTSASNIPQFNATGGLTGLKEALTGFFDAPASGKTYTLDESAPFTYTVNSLVIKASAGTGSVRLLVNGSAMAGSAIGVSANRNSASTNGSVLVGERLAIQFVSADSSCVDVGFSIKTTR